MFVITGSNGFIGSAMVKELNSKGIFDIIAVDSVSLAERSDLLKGSKITDFLLRDEFLDFLNGSTAKNIKAIFHMGACSSTTERDVDFLYRNNTLYTQQLFEWCRDNKIPFIYASSAATYGNGELGFSDQIDPNLLKPLNPYGDSKLAFDRWVIKQPPTSNPWYGLKFFNVFGPNEFRKGPMASLVYKAFHQVKETQKMGLFKSYHPDFADGRQLRDFVYVKDVTRWMWELFEKKPQNGIYNMGFGKARSWLDLAQGVFESLSLPLTIEWLEMPENIKSQYQYFTEADMSTWKSLGMSEPLWSLEEGIKDYVSNYLLNHKNIFGDLVEYKEK